jgi:hypothetical protein
MPAYTVLGPIGHECMDYGIVVADTPLHALGRVHIEGFGGRELVAVRDSRLVFRNPADQELVSGYWRVVECRANGPVQEYRFLIPVPARAAA